MDSSDFLSNLLVSKPLLIDILSKTLAGIDLDFEEPLEGTAGPQRIGPLEDTLTKAPLTIDTITFGKYKGKSLDVMLRDRKYCFWLIEQDWFPKQYEYLYNRVKEYKPKVYFMGNNGNSEAVLSPENFLEKYIYFSLCPIEKLEIQLTEEEKVCYRFYLDTIKSLKDKIELNKDVNKFNIKAPSSWLKSFEKSGLSRDVFKEFLSAYELPNIPYIVEDIKRMGGIDYKGARSFIIAKQNSLRQEEFWENILKKYYGEDLGSQFKFSGGGGKGNCFFDFISIKTNTIFECKLGLKDFNLEQHVKYSMVLETYNLVYLVGQNCIINLREKIIYTTDYNEYRFYLMGIPIMKDPSKFDLLIQSFPIKEIKTLDEYFTRF